MRKMYVLQNFASQGVRYAKGRLVSMEKSLADRFESEGLLRDALEHLGIEAPEVDLSKYVTIEEHNKVKGELTQSQQKVKELEARVEELEKELEDKPLKKTPKSKKAE